MNNNKNSNSLFKSVFQSRYAVVFYIVILLFVLLSVLTRISIINEIKDYNSIKNIRIEITVPDNQIKNQAAACEKRLADSDVILTARFTGNRKSAHYSTLSTMTVTKVIKGDEKIIADEINVYENNAIAANKSRLYLRNFTPVNLFEEGREYLLFLNNTEEYDEEYTNYKNIKLNEFVMANYFASSFCTEETDTKILSKNYKDNIVDYNDFKASEFILFSENQKNIMYDLKSKVLAEYL